MFSKDKKDNYALDEALEALGSVFVYAADDKPSKEKITPEPEPHNQRPLKRPSEPLSKNIKH
jgi:hypothetical protein